MDASWSEFSFAESYLLLLSKEVLKHHLPNVSKIDCDNCRCVVEKRAIESVKCCDVIPRFPNFLVGEILSNKLHPVFLEWIEERRADPFYMLAPPDILQDYHLARIDGHYGEACPLLFGEEGHCSVYSYRPSLCITYHCYYPNYLWKEAWSCLASTLELLQESACRFFVSLAGFEQSKMSAVWDKAGNEFDIWDGNSQKSWVYDSLWQDKIGEEAAFYIWCFRELQKNTSSCVQKSRSLYRAQLMERLHFSGKLTKQRESELFAEEVESKEPESLAPSKSLRKRYQRSYTPANMNDLTIREQESILIWYLERLSQKNWLEALRTWF